VRTNADIEHALEEALRTLEPRAARQPIASTRVPPRKRVASPGLCATTNAPNGLIARFDPANRDRAHLSRSTPTPSTVPVKLISAMRHAVFPGGARVRPQLCLAVVAACSGDPALPAATSTAAAIELMHCASLVHDDLPCFDNADLRRGIPSVHKRYGEPLAVLAGDALIVLSMQTMARGLFASLEPQTSSLSVQDAFAVMETVNAAVGMPAGIIAGQAWESETEIDLRAYHQAKTGALFVAATCAGALLVGDRDPCWYQVGARLGEAYQIADDIRDHVLSDQELGKPGGQDALHERPSAVLTLGLDGAEDQLRDLIDDAADAVPTCQGADNLRVLIQAQVRRLVPNQLTKRGAVGG